MRDHLYTWTRRLSLVAWGTIAAWGLLLLAGPSTPQARQPEQPYDNSGNGHSGNGHAGSGHSGSGDVCATGCAAEPQGGDGLGITQLEGWLRRYAAAPVEHPGVALETLLFYASEVRELAALQGLGELDEEHKRFLLREISRSEAILEVRFVDALGRERLRLDPTEVPLGVKQHLFPRTEDLQVPEVSGTIKRVGLGHLWARL